MSPSVLERVTAKKLVRMRLRFIVDKNGVLVASSTKEDIGLYRRAGS